MNGFISGTYFNRCKRLHPLISLAFQLRHFEKFIEDEHIDIPEGIVIFLDNVFSSKGNAEKVDCEQLLKVFEKYDTYCKLTLAGAHGRTPQFYFTYINLVDHYLHLNASIRIPDFELFKSVLSKIANLFFIFNQQNYARYLVKYIDNLSKVNGLLEESLQKGSFRIKRTPKIFSRQPIELTLEQTINCDAAKSLTGVIHFTGSISARQRWCRSHSIRATVTSHVMMKAGLNSVQDVTADLRPHNINKSAAQLQKLTDTIKKDLNPFDASLDKSSLMRVIESKIESVTPIDTNVIIFDGFFLIHTMTNVPKIGKVALAFLKILLYTDAKEVDVVFDRYISPSIKDYERNLRGKVDRVLKIVGPDQIRPQDFSKELRNGQFKK